MLPESVAHALARSKLTLHRDDGADAVVARHRAGRPRDDDDRAARRIIDELRAAQEPDGSWGAALVPTAAALDRIRRLSDARGLDPPASAVDPGIAWLRTRQGAPGRYGDGCSPDRHRRGLCHHALGGFFSAAPPDHTLAPLRLPGDAEIHSQQGARLTASCIALRTLLGYGLDTVDIRLHIRGLQHLIRLWDGWQTDLFPPTTGLVALHTLLAAPPTPAARDALDHGLRLVRTSQRADGSWPDADTFVALELLLAAADAGVPADTWDPTLRRAAALLAAMQADDGTWGNGQSHRIVIGWRVLRRAARRFGSEPAEDAVP